MQLVRALAAIAIALAAEPLVELGGQLVIASPDLDPRIALELLAHIVL